MRLKKKIELLEKKIDFLTSDSYKKAKKYEEQEELLKKIRFSVDKISFFIDKQGLVGVNLEYSIPKLQVLFDDDSEIIFNETFYAINKLNLISIEDMQKISQKLEEAKRKNLK